MNMPYFYEENPKALQVNKLVLITRYFFWFRRWRLRAGRLPGNSHLKSGEHKHGTLDQSSDPWLYDINHILLLDTERRQRCRTQTSWCYGSNAYRLVYRHFEYVQFNMNFVSPVQLMLLYEVLKKFFLCLLFFLFFLFMYVILRDSLMLLFHKN